LRTQTTLALVVAIALFLPIWINHAYLGQVALPFTAACLALMRVATTEKRGLAFQALLYVLSIKVLSIFPLAGVRWQKKDPARLAFAGLCGLGLSATVFALGPDTILGNFRSWLAAAASGTKHLQGGGQVSVAGREAQGIPSMLFRVLHLDPNRKWLVLAVCVITAAGVAWAWARASRDLTAHEKWAGWIAWCAAVQPLAGFYSFCMAFPLAALALDSALRSRSRARIAGAVLGTVFITLITRKSLGSLGEGAELISIKSCGILFLSVSIARAAAVRAAPQTEAAALL
jgi:hypothetical protein